MKGEGNTLAFNKQKDKWQYDIYERGIEQSKKKEHSKNKNEL